MPKIYDADLEAADAGRRSRTAAAAGADHLGATLYELGPGNSMHRVGIFDSPHPPDRRFGALFDIADAVEDYGGGTAAIVPPGSGSPGSSSGG